MNDGVPVVIDPPPGNDPDAPGRRHMQPNCRHMWVVVQHPLRIPTGKLRCLRCRAEIMARKEEEGPWEPTPADPVMGY